MSLTRHYEDVSVLVSVVSPVTGRTVADREARGLVADQLKDDYSGGSNESNITEYNNELFSLSNRLTALLNIYIKSSANNFNNFYKEID
jgi:hypothetical protein